MYKLLLCTRYLRTRYLAFVCIVSVMLGVATLIVVNSVMSGFGNKLRDRLHGVLADVLVETDRTDGFSEDPGSMVARIQASPAGRYVEAASPTVEVFALLQFHTWDRYGRKVPITKHVRLIGVDPARHARTGNFSEYLVRQRDVAAPTFDLGDDAKERFERNRLRADWDDLVAPMPVRGAAVTKAEPRPGHFLDLPPIEANPAPLPPAVVPPPVIPPGLPPRVPGVILGFSIAHYRHTDPDTNATKDYPLLQTGDDVLLATVSAEGMRPVSGTFAVADFFKSEMSEYDAGFAYAPLDELQRMRGMGGRVNTIQLRLKDEVRNDSRVMAEVVAEVKKLFPPEEVRVLSWEQHQGPLLAAIDIERGILNLLLFMIVGVAGFSVLAIFTMIVAEKYRDIGILKSLGASNRGVMGIFVGYGLMLGLIGCGFGTAAGLAITDNINEIEAWLARRTGQQIFDRSVYYFDKIPTNVEAGNVGLINFGAVGTAVLFSVVPAWRAARLHPVRALRFE